MLCQLTSNLHSIVVDVQSELHQVSLQVDEKRKLVVEMEGKLNRLMDEKNVVCLRMRCPLLTSNHHHFVVDIQH